MLAVTKYTQDYVDQCRARIDADVSAYTRLAATGPSAEAFEPVFFNNMVLALDRLFVHRLRKHEGKDGNPLNEVRVIADSLMEHGGVLTPNNTIKLKPEDSLLGHRPGDQIRLSEADYRALAAGFFDELENKYV
jgi:hypothetical protein